MTEHDADIRERLQAAKSRRSGAPFWKAVLWACCGMATLLATFIAISFFNTDGKQGIKRNDAGAAEPIAGITEETAPLETSLQPKEAKIAGGKEQRKAEAAKPSAPPKDQSAKSQVDSQEKITPGKWYVQRGTSDFDDSPTILAILAADNDIPLWLKNFRPMLIVRCHEKIQVDVVLAVGGSASVENVSDKHTVWIRIDDGEPFSEQWSESTNHEALFAPRPIVMAKRIAAAKRVRFRFVPFNANPATIEFSVAGLDAYLEEIVTTCHNVLLPNKSG